MSPLTTYSMFMAASAYIRSQKRTYQSASAKKIRAENTNSRSNIITPYPLSLPLKGQCQPGCISHESFS